MNEISKKSNKKISKQTSEIRDLTGFSLKFQSATKKYS